MLGPDQDNPEFFQAIERFLAQQKEKQELDDIQATAEIVMNLFDGNWESIHRQVLDLAELWTLRPDFTSRRISREQAVKRSPTLTVQNQSVLNLIDKIGYATEGIYIIAEADKGTTHIPRTASLHHVSSPLPIETIRLHQFTSEGLQYMSEIANALGINNTHGHFTRISITGIASGFTDEQTRAAMEQIFLRCPSAPQTLTSEMSTDYYLYGGATGKVIHRPSPLLVGRSLDSPLHRSSALSEFTSGDNYLAMVALKALNEKLSSLI